MAEYIDREAAKQAIFDYICRHTMSKFPSKELLMASKRGAEGAFNEIDYVPDADVVEVRHGEWRFVGQDRWNDTYECSLCRKMTTDDSIYCPNCGAKMDGKGDVE